MTRKHVHLPRPAPTEMPGVNSPRLIVIHAMAEYILDPDPIHAPDFLRGYGYSAHSLIEPTGTNIRCRQDNEFAYHAKKFNRDSLGIEFLLPGEHNYGSFLAGIAQPGWVTPEAYAAGFYQVKEWCNLYDVERVVRHSDISPGRKVDPGAGFPLSDFLHDLGFTR